MSIASDAPAAHTPSVMRSVSLHPKITGRCVRSSVSLGAASYGKRRKVSITIRLRRYATSVGGERESRSERSSRGYQEILRVEAAMPRTARSGGVSGMLHRTTVRRADLIEGTVSAGLGAAAWQAGETEVLTVAAIFVTSQKVCRKSATLRFLYNRHGRVSRI